MNSAGLKQAGVPTSVADELPRGDSVARNTAFSFAGQLTTAGFTAALTLYLARALGPSEFGLFALAMGVGTVLLLPADFGISSSSARFLAERRASRSGVADVLRTATRLKLAISGSVCACMFLLAEPIADAYGHDGLLWAIRGMAIAVFAQNLMMLYSSATEALTRTSVNFRIIFSESVVETAASVALVLAGGGAAGAAFGRATGYVVGAVVGGVLIMRVVGRRVPRPADHARLTLRQISAYAGALLVVDGAFALFTQIDVLLIGALLTASAAGLFQAPLRLISFLHYPGLSIAAGVAPRLALQAGGRRETEPFRQAIRYLVILQAFLSALVLLWATPIINLLLGPKFADSANVLRALTPFVFLSGLSPLLSLGASYLGEARKRVPIAITTVAVNGAIDAVLIPHIGIVAGAVGTNVAYTIYVPAHFWICRRVIHFPLRPLAWTTVRALVAAAAASGVFALFGTGRLSVVVMLGGGLCAAAVFVAALFATRELGRAELAELRNGWRLFRERRA